MNSKRTEQLYLDEISLLAQDEEAFEAYVRLNLRKIKKHRRKFNIPVVGISGTEGKTITKRMISAIFGEQRAILETPPDCSTASGVTSTLLRLSAEHELAMLELGIVNPEQFKNVVRIAEPTIGVVTNIGESHLANLGDKYTIADAKEELVRYLPRSGYAVLNIDDDLVTALSRFAPESRVVKFGLNQSAHFYASAIDYLGPDGIAFKVNDFYHFHMPIYSSSAVYNALTAIAVARLMGLPFEQIQQGLQERFSLYSRKGNLLRHKQNYILDYTYDATFNSVTKACESLVQFKPFSRKLTLVIGDMNKPGPHPDEAHLKLGYYVAALPIDSVVTLGENARHIIAGMKRLNKKDAVYEACGNHAEVLAHLKRNETEGTTILFTGKSDLEMQHLVDALIAE
ncbi:MAG: Mur ligase family protein [Calditrichia bacterium]